MPPDERAIITLHSVSGDDFHTQMAKATETRTIRIKQYIESHWAGDDVREPIDALNVLHDAVSVNGVLHQCIRLKATCEGRLGYLIKESPYTSDPLDEKERAEMERWVLATFEPSFPTVMFQFCHDYHEFGMGILRIDENLVEIKDPSGRIAGREIAQVSHVARTECAPLKPRRVRRTIQVKVIEGVSRTTKAVDVEDPDDLVFPRWVIGTGDAKRYARSFGDKRYIHKYTGETQKQSWGKSPEGDFLDGPSIIAISEYDCRDTVLGWPQWYSEKKSLDVVWEIGRYEWGHFRSNCMPNMICIIPKAETTDGKTMGDKFQEFLRDTAAQRFEGADTRKVITVEIPKALLREGSVGKNTFLIHEVKGPPPDQFLEMEKRKNQLVALANGVPPGLVHSETGALGSGKDKAEELKRFKEWVINPEQVRIELEVLDKLVQRGTNFRTAVIRLKRIDTSDPKVEAEIAKVWDEVRFLKLAEKREKANIQTALDPEDQKRSEKLGNVFFLGPNEIPVSLDELERILDGAINDDDSDDQQDEKPPESSGIKPFTEYLTKVLGGINPAEFRDNVLPVLKSTVVKFREESEKK